MSSTVIDPGPQKPLAPGHILRLPNELLDKIFTATTQWPPCVDGYSYGHLYADHLALTLVCRRFHHVATTILYSRIVLGLRNNINRTVVANCGYDAYTREDSDDEEDRDPGVSVRLSRLHHALEANPGLRSLCTDVVFGLEGTHWDSDEFLSQGKDFATWLTNTKSLRLHDGYGHDQVHSTAAFLQVASANMPALERLALTAREQSTGSLGVNRLFSWKKYLDFPNLKTLHLVGITDKDDEPRLFEKPERDGRFTELSIRDLYMWESLEPFRLLMSWPARLNKFTYLGLGRWGHAIRTPELKDVCSYLVPHKRSLEYVQIGSLAWQNIPRRLSDKLSMVDFTIFECLTSLSLSYWDTGSGLGEVNLLAPRLQTFEWTFDTQDERRVDIDFFQKTEADFLQRLALGAASRKVPLRSIAIVFTARNRISHKIIRRIRPPDDPLEYPWDLMDRLAGEIRPLGIKLAYNRPSVTRCDYELLADRYERERERPSYYWT